MNQSGEQLVKVPFNGGHVLVVESKDRVIVKTVCDLLTMDLNGQAQRIKRDPRLKAWACKIHVVDFTSQKKGDGVLTIPRKKLAAFLYGIQPNMVKDEAIRANLIQLQEELEDAMDAYFNARMGGATKEQVQQAIRDAVQAAETKHRRALGDLRDELGDLKADNADLLVALRSRMTAPIGEADKKELTALAGKVADLMIATMPNAGKLSDEERAAEWRMKFADLIQDVADRVGAGGRAWNLMTPFEGAKIRSHLTGQRNKYAKRLWRMKKKATTVLPRQLKLVV